MQKKQTKKTKSRLRAASKYTLLFVAIFSLVTFLKVSASSGTRGWLWGGGAELDGSLPYDSKDTNVGWISASNKNMGGVINYGLTVPDGDGDVNGYVWSENMGWISFNDGDVAGCPDGNCVSKRVGNNIVGWARFLNIKDAYNAVPSNSGGWQGWIHFNGPTYNVGIDTAAGKLTGYGWSDELGWIKFDGVTLEANKVLGVSIVAIGTVTSTVPDASINCNSGSGTCSGEYAPGTAVTLVENPGALHHFVNWSGACSGSANTCTVTMDAAKNVTANFAPNCDAFCKWETDPADVCKGEEIKQTDACGVVGANGCTETTVGTKLCVDINNFKEVAP